MKRPGWRSASGDRCWRVIAGLVLAGVTPATVDGSDWAVTQARGRPRPIELSIDEGTWMSVHPSPTEPWIVFDLLAHVYRVPTSGGEAECLTAASGLAVNYHPRYSPDGRRIAFISDRAGRDNLWLMNADGSDPRPVWLEEEARHSQPAWMPDGASLVVRRRVSRTGSAFRVESGLWQVPVDGGQPNRLVSDGADRASWPSVSSDGRWLFYEVFLGEGLPVGHADTARGFWQLRRLDLETGQTVDLTTGLADQRARSSSGGAFAPEVSPDGHWLAFGRQVPGGTLSVRGHRLGPRTALWLRDLQTGSERPLLDPIEKDLSEAGDSSRVVPGYGWSRDGRVVFFSQGGRIRRFEVASGRAATVPFVARVERTASEMVRPAGELDQGPIPARALRWPTRSPDGSRIAFEAVGRIWILEVVSQEVRRLTGEAFAGVFERFPAWSPDGRWVAFSTTEERGGGYLWKADVAGLLAPVRLTPTRGEYAHPVWAPDGRSLVVAQGAGATARGRGLISSGWFDLVRLSAAGEAVLGGIPVRDSGWDPEELERRPVVRASFGPEGKIFFPERARERYADGEEHLVTHLVSVDSEGGDRRVHLRFPFAEGVVVSPDGRRAVFQADSALYLTPVPPATESPAPWVDPGDESGTVRPLSGPGALFPRWLDAATVELGRGTEHLVHRLDHGDTEETALHLEVPRRVGHGRVAFLGGRLITLGEAGVIEEGNLLVEDGRISCVGECGPYGADRLIDARGRTLMPGLVDVRVHSHREHREMIPPLDSESAAHLAFGVTTVLEPSAGSLHVLEAAELVEAGRLLGPRIFGTGDPLVGVDGGHSARIDSLAAAADQIDRRIGPGAIGAHLSGLPLRRQRQWIAEVARRRGLMLTGEGGDLVDMVGMVLDGVTAWQGSLAQAPIYSDLSRFLGLAGVTWAANLAVGGPGPWNEEYFLQDWPFWRDPRLRSFLPWRRLLPHTRRRIDRPATDYSFPVLAEGVADLLAAGGHAALGSSGRLPGLAAHWEVWMLAEALGPQRALEVACLGGARLLGLEGELGSLEEGKVADLLVLGGNPLDDIRQTLEVDLVVKGGIVWHAGDLVEVWPETGEPVEWVIDAWMNDATDRPLSIFDEN